MSLRALKWLAILLPPCIIGGFEYIRHEFLLNYFSMEAGNFYITLLTLLISYLFSVWMFRTISGINQRLSEEQARLAVFEERERIARELHDDIAQILFFLNVTLKQGKMDEARSAVSEIDGHLRQAIFNLRSSREDSVSFTNRAGKWIEEWSAITGIDVTQNIHLTNNRFTAGEEVQLFAIIQEAFTNIRKHSRANHAKIALEESFDGWELLISDDGSGIAYTDTDVKKYGISMMQKRADELGASFEIKESEDGGTEVRLTAGAGRGKRS